MTLEIGYEGDKLVLPEMVCECGMIHQIPDMDIYIGKDILSKCAQYVTPRQLGKKALLITDNILYDIAGKEAESVFQEAGYQVVLCRLDREGELIPDREAVGEILLAMEEDIDFFIAVGSGSINDLARYVAFHTGRPFVSIGTAASMDGYTSVIAPLLDGNLKVNKPASYPLVLICDLDIMKDAPYEMHLAGFGDVLGKYIAKADWLFGEIVNEEPYCPTCAEMISQALSKCVQHVDGIIDRTDEGVQSLIEGLILAGLTILIIGNTRAVASNEHNMAHYWEMMKLLRNEKPASHGMSVGVATGYAIRFYEYFLSYDMSKLDPDKILAQRLPEEERRKVVLQKYGPKVGPSIIRDNPMELPEGEEHKRRITRITNEIGRIRKELDFIPSWKQVKQIYEKMGFPISSDQIGIDKELLKDAMLYAKDYRDRYSVFKAANELGILEELMEMVINDIDML
ncbi:MAG: sn-glycerol-1-phosphate dehydrogenase [Clostridia bacterium]|jgi:glycerol-1-phosphate dehydrogenase [NAD(P)+]